MALGQCFAWERRPGQDELFIAKANGLDASHGLEKALPSALRGDGQVVSRFGQDRQTAKHELGEAVSPASLPLSQQTYGSPDATSVRQNLRSPRRLDSIRPRSPPLGPLSA